MTTIRRHRILGSLAPLVVAGLITVPFATPAFANDDDVIRRGPCSGASDWKLKASPENGRIEVQGEVDSNRVGQSWHWKIVQDGAVAAQGTGVTKGRSGSFEARRVLPNTAGSDGFVFRAHNAASGESCRGSVSF